MSGYAAQPKSIYGTCNRNRMASGDKPGVAQIPASCPAGSQRGDLVAFIDRFQGRGLVVREHDRRDRRRLMLTITASGKRLLRKAP